MSAGGPAFLPYGRQEIDEGDVAAVAAALREDMITQGPTVEAFERAFAEYVGARHAVAFSSGTAALHGAAHAVGVGPGDRCVTAPITFAASMNCGVYLGGTPAFADIDPATWCLDPHAAAAIEDARMIVPVSFAGLPADLEPLRATGARIVEDAAHALGALRDGRPVGGPGGADVTCFSLHPVKAMTTGEGGMATTEDDDLAERLRTFRTHGIRRGAATTPGEHDGAWFYEQQELGFNYRITDFQCALGLRQLERLEGWVLRRNALADQYRALLADEAQRVALPPAAPAGSRHAHHLFVVRFAGGAPVRRRLFDGLRAAGIGAQVHYIPLHRMPYYRDTWGVPQDAFPHADAYYAGALSLPMYPGLAEDDVARVVEAVRRLLDE